MATPSPELLRDLLTSLHDPKKTRKILRRSEVAQWLLGIAGGLWRRSQLLQRCFENAEAFHGRLLGKLWERLSTLSKVDDLRDPAAFIAKLLRNLARDEVRRLMAEKRGGGRAQDSLDDQDGSHQRSLTAPTRSALDGIIERQTLRELLKLCRDPTVNLSPGRRATFIAFVAPGQLTDAELDQPGGSFARSPEETRLLIREHFSEEPPLLFEDGARTLAWIMRCDAPTHKVRDWDTWLRVAPGDARKALDTLQKNFRRAREDLVTLYRNSGGAR